MSKKKTRRNSEGKRPKANHQSTSAGNGSELKVQREVLDPYKWPVFTLPDQSQVIVDPSSLRFYDLARLKEIQEQLQQRVNELPSKFDLTKLKEFMETPSRKFSEYFRRVPPYRQDGIAYSPSRGYEHFDVTFIGKLYEFPGHYRGGMFCSINIEYHFLDGGIVDFIGYGWGNNSYRRVLGAEGVRAICMFYGIIQPQAIKLEGTRRPLAVLLEEMTRVPLSTAKNIFYRYAELNGGSIS